MMFQCRETITCTRLGSAVCIKHHPVMSVDQKVDTHEGHVHVPLSSNRGKLSFACVNLIIPLPSPHRHSQPHLLTLPLITPGGSMASLSQLNSYMNGAMPVMSPQAVQSLVSSQAARPMKDTLVPAMEHAATLARPGTPHCGMSSVCAHGCGTVEIPVTFSRSLSTRPATTRHNV